MQFYNAQIFSVAKKPGNQRPCSYLMKHDLLAAQYLNKLALELFFAILFSKVRRSETLLTV